MLSEGLRGGARAPQARIEVPPGTQESPHRVVQPIVADASLGRDPGGGFSYGAGGTEGRVHVPGRGSSVEGNGHPGTPDRVDLTLRPLLSELPLEELEQPEDLLAREPGSGFHKGRRHSDAVADGGVDEEVSPLERDGRGSEKVHAEAPEGCGESRSLEGRDGRSPIGRSNPTPAGGLLHHGRNVVLEEWGEGRHIGVGHCAAKLFGPQLGEEVVQLRQTVPMLFALLQKDEDFLEPLLKGR